MLISLAHVALLLASLVFFHRLGALSRAVVVLISAALTCTNFQCVAHNFLHLPFFRSRALNRCFGVLNSISLGMPQHLYRAHHLNHHKYNNDQPRGPDLQTCDRSSLFRGSARPGQPVGALRYVARGLLQADLGPLWREATAAGNARQVLIESAGMLGFVAFAAWLEPLALLGIILPGLVLGYAGALLENYCEHFGAVPGNRRTDSVSCYNRLYNLLWFNNGYHQEHHFRPQVHWTLLPTLRPLMLAPNQRRVVRGLHLANLWTPLRSTPRPVQAPEREERG